MKPWQKWLVAVAVALTVYVGVRWVRAKAMPETIPTAVARSGEFLVTTTVRGSLWPARSIEIHAPHIHGLQISFIAPMGSRVKKGDVVARFDSSSAQQDYEAKVATLRQAQANLDQAKATAKITNQQDALDLATAKNAVASAELDASKAAIVSAIQGAEADLALSMAKEKLKVEQATIAAHNASNAAKIATAQRATDKAQADADLDAQQLKEMDVQAPSDGVFNVMTNNSNGFANRQPFKIGDSVWARGSFAQIPDLSSLQVLAKVSEVERGQIHVGDAVHVHLDALPELTLAGKVTSISALAEADFGNIWPPPQVFRVLATLDHLDPRLRPDMNGGEDVITQRIPHAIIVPAEAIFTVNGKPVVYVADGKKFKMTEVQVLARNPDATAISGVSPGAAVALEQPGLQPGAQPK